MLLPSQSRFMRTGLLTISAALILASESVAAKCIAEAPDAIPAQGVELQEQNTSTDDQTEKDQVGYVYLLNDSGSTLIPGNMNVSDNGKRLVSLPRNAYTVIPLLPGIHLLQPTPTHYNQKVELKVSPGQKYYVVIAYKPGRSWAFPFAGSPVTLREISEQSAAVLLEKMKRIPAVSQ